MGPHAIVPNLRGLWLAVPAVASVGAGASAQTPSRVQTLSHGELHSFQGLAFSLASKSLLAAVGGNSGNNSVQVWEFDRLVPAAKPKD